MCDVCLGKSAANCQGNVGEFHSGETLTAHIRPVSIVCVWMLTVT